LKIILFAFFGVIMMSIMACSEGKEVKSTTSPSPKAKFRNSNKLNKPFHGDLSTADSAVTVTPGVAALKNNHLDVSSKKTIGEAFDAYKYAIKKEWRETATKNGPHYIDYICWFNVGPVSYSALKEGIVKQGLEIKFVIHEDGVTYIAMASRIDIKSDGMLYTTPLEPPEIRKTVTAIYENREITF